MSVKITGTLRAVNCHISYEFGKSEILRTNKTVDMSALYTYNTLNVNKKLQISTHYIYCTHTANFIYV
jgi:hypothetical protein